MKMHRDLCISGLVLIEIMIAMSIGLLFISLIVQMYLTGQQSLKLETALNTIQDNAKTINSIFQTEIQQAGNIGCAKLTKDFPIISYGEYQLNSANKISINQENQITIRYAEYPDNTLIEFMSSDNRIYINKAVTFNAGDILIISDCKKAEIFITEEVKINHGNQQIITKSPLHNRYEKFAEVSRLVINKFYLANSSQGKKSLYVENIHHQKSELVSGISQMQIQFTTNTLGVAIAYVLTAGSLKKNWYFYSALKR